MKVFRDKYWVSILLLAIMLSSSCKKEKEEPKDILMRYDKLELTYNDVISRIPVGLLPADSAALFKAIADGWVKNAVISDFAENRLLDLDAINQKVDDYRRSLIVQEYLSRMSESHSPKVEEREVKEYYDRHRNEMKLEVPLVKGIFLKIDADSKGKESLKGLLSSDKPEAIDKLEQEWLDRALEYNYFRDKWIDWETISGMIPHRFGDADKFLEENKYFEIEYGDCSYYLMITDYLHSGEEQPYEFASIWISNLLTQKDLAAYEQSLITSLLNDAIKDKKLEIMGYDPIKHELIENNVILNDEYEKNKEN